MSTDAPAPPGFFSRLAQPGFFMAWSRFVVWPLAALSAVLFGLGIWYALVASPGDYQMGDTVRIMYVHVPNAWLSQACYGLMAAAAVGSLVWRHPLADVAAKAAAPLGAVFTAIMLMTGAIWGRPTWGTYWVWDGRLTSALVLLLIYLGIVALWRAIEDQARAARIVAIVTLVGVINVIIVRYSVEWWATLHQPPTLTDPNAPGLPGELLTPLFLMLGAYTALFATLLTAAMRTEIRRRRIAGLKARTARTAAASPAS